MCTLVRDFPDGAPNRDGVGRHRLVPALDVEPIETNVRSKRYRASVRRMSVRIVRIDVGANLGDGRRREQENHRESAFHGKDSVTGLVPNHANQRRGNYIRWCGKLE